MSPISLVKSAEVCQLLLDQGAEVSSASSMVSSEHWTRN